MKTSLGLLACLVSAAALGSAAVATAAPVVLTPSEMDDATAGVRPDVAVRLAAVRARLEELRARVNATWRWTPTATATTTTATSSHTNGGTTSVTSNVKIVRSVSNVVD